MKVGNRLLLAILWAKSIPEYPTISLLYIMHFMIFTTSYVLQLGVLKFNFFRNAEKIWGNLHTSKKNWEFLLIICGLFINSWTLRRLFFLVFNADFTQCARPSKALGAISVSMVGISEPCRKIIWAIFSFKIETDHQNLGKDQWPFYDHF